MLFSHWKLIGGSGVILGIAGFLIAFFSPPDYIARTTLMIEGQGPSSTVASYLNLLGVGSTGGQEISGDQLIELLESRRIIGNALYEQVEIEGKRQLLGNYYLDALGMRESWEEEPMMTGFQFKSAYPQLTYLEDSILNLVHLEIRDNFLKIENRESGIISLQVISPSEPFSKYLNDHMIAAATNFYVHNKVEREEETLEVMQRQLDSVQVALTIAEERLAKLKDASNRMVKAQGMLEEYRLTREVETLNVILGEAVKNLEVAKFNMMIKKPMVQTIDRPVFPLYRDKMKPLYGLILGGFLGGLLVAGYFIVRRMIDDVLDMEKTEAH